MSSPLLALGIKNMREERVLVEAGYDGEYGKIKILSPDANNLKNKNQLSLL